MLALALLAVVLLAGCSARTTGVTDVSATITHTEFHAKVTFNAVGSCSAHCTFFMRWRLIGTDAWSNGPSHTVGAIGETRWHETVDGLAPLEKYEYQTCGKEDSWSSVVCVGPNGRPDSTDKFTTNGDSLVWPQFGFDGAHSSSSPGELTLDVGNVSKLKRAWFGALSDATSPSVSNGVVYVGARNSGNGLVTAYRMACRIDGDECTQRLWTADAGAAVISSVPAVTSSDVAVGSEDGKLYGFDKTSGAPKWTATTGGAIRSAPMSLGGTFYIGSEDGSVYAFRCSGTTCARLWKTATFGAVTSSPAYDPLPGQSDGRVFAGSADHHLYAFNRLNGGILWTGSTGGAIHSSPTVSNNVVYVGSDDGKFYAFPSDCVAPLGSCTPLWTATTGGPITGSPAMISTDGGVVYFGSTDGKLYAYSASCGSCTAGQFLWSGTTGGPITTRPAVANGVVYVASDDGKLNAFDADGCGAASCQPLSTVTTGGSPGSPAVAGGKVYVRDSSGLRAYALP